MKTCTICARADRFEVDKAIVDQRSLRNIAKQFNVSFSAVNRHKQHIPKALAEAKQAETLADSNSLLSRVEQLAQDVKRIYDGAMEDGEWSGAAAAARELRGCLELLAKLSGELQTGGARIAVAIAQIQNLSIADLSTEQLGVLYDRVRNETIRAVEQMSDEELAASLAETALRAGFDRASLAEAPLFDDDTVPPPPGGSRVCWDVRDARAIEAAKKSGHLQASFECPPPVWRPYREAGISDRLLMLRAAWKRTTGLELPEGIEIEQLGPVAAIVIEFDLDDPDPEWWHTWPRVRLRCCSGEDPGAVGVVPESLPERNPQMIEGKVSV